MRIKPTAAILSLIALLLLAGCNNSDAPSDKPSRDAKPASSGENAQTSPDTVKSAGTLPANIQEKLTGKWLRADGAYTIEVFSVKPDGGIDAGYFNPNPVNVGKSEWKIADNKLYMRVILKDVNYPGSTYTLMYTPENDMLSGNYFQAVEGIDYDVIFRRVK
jgi:hypothetical protein